ncbi:MAG: extracellular solute-binding protein [Treponema sp.]|nr:extracellular solute-binding protein [Treponema sp.]
MRKVLVMSLAIFILVSGTSFVFAGGGGAGRGRGANELTLYFSHAAGWTDPIIREFTERTGIRVHLVSAGTGALAARIRAESANPMADVLWGGNPDAYVMIYDLLEEFTPQELHMLYPGSFDPGHRWFGTSIDPMVIIYNPRLVPPAEAPRGWADLINPRFRGMLAHANPVTSGSAFMALFIKLKTMGGDNDVGWGYMSEFVRNLDGRLLGSSAGTFRGVSAGEFMVGITYEEAALRYQAYEADLRVVYPIEGSSRVPSPIAIIRNARNPENAQQFVNFILSRDVQSRLGAVHRRSVRTDITLPPAMIPNDQLGDLYYDITWIQANRERILDNWRQIIVEN